MNTGQKLRFLREKAGYSQEEVAKILGIGRTTYLKYETGENRPTRKLNELARLFNVSTDYLLGNDPPRTEPATVKPFTDDEVELIKLYRFTDEWGREQIMSLAESNAKRIAFTQKKRLEVAM